MKISCMLMSTKRTAAKSKSTRGRPIASLKRLALLTLGENLNNLDEISVPAEFENDWPEIVRLSRKYVIIMRDDEPRVVAPRNLRSAASSIIEECVSMYSRSDKTYSSTPFRPSIDDETDLEVIDMLLRDTMGVVSYIVDLDGNVHKEIY